MFHTASYTVFYFLNIAVDVGEPNQNESDIEDWVCWELVGQVGIYAVSVL